MNTNDLHTLTQRLFDRQNATNGVVTEVGDTTAQTYTAGTYYAIQFITDCVITGLTAENSTVADATYPAGFVLYIDITSITAVAGNLYVLYKV
tara:strand:- start:3098 stop:3376 length:279 start_codon:yes stop_codon:yes gene_type:complete